MKNFKPFTHYLACAALTVAGLSLSAPSAQATTRAAAKENAPKRELTMPSKIGMTLLRSTDMGPDNFILRLSMIDSRITCGKLSPLYFTKSTESIYADIKITAYAVDQGSQPKTTQNCKATAQTPTADIPFNVSELQSRGIKKIRLNYMNHNDVFDLILEDKYVAMRPNSQINRKTASINAYIPMPGPVGSTPLELWLMPYNSVGLTVPHAPGNKDISLEIQTFALQQGLKPMTDVIPNFTAPSINPQVYYFVDEGNRFVKSLQNDEMRHLGQINLSERDYGLNGDEVAIKSYDVYMKKPGITE
jgi:hypothetical protein